MKGKKAKTTEAIVSQPILKPPEQKQITMEDLQKLSQSLLNTMNAKFAELKGDMDGKLVNMEKQNGIKLNDILIQMNAKIDQIREDVAEIFTKLIDNFNITEEIFFEIQDVTDDLDIRIKTMEKSLERMEADHMTFQFGQLEYALRLRGLKENKEEKLQSSCAEVFASLVQMDLKDIQLQIQKAYRVNSWVARQKNLSRDVLVFFESKQLRNQIAQAAYNQKTLIYGQEVRIMKEIPYKMLKLRREFNFLTEELRKLNVQYRWDIPIGLVFYLQGKRYRLNTIQKAKDFYHTILKKAETPQQADNNVLIPVEISTPILENAATQAMIPVSEKDQQMSARSRNVEKFQQVQQRQMDLSAPQPIRMTEDRSRRIVNLQNVIQVLQAKLNT